jgi:hypothetical protein
MMESYQKEPSIITELINEESRLHENTEFICVYNLISEKSQISWYHNKNLIDINRIEKYLIRNMLNTCSLTILNIQKEDDGVYEIRIQTENDLIKSSAYLTILSGKKSFKKELKRYFVKFWLK